MSYAYTWEFIVKVEQMDNFIDAYGPEGDWVKLFSDDAAYLDTKVFRDKEQINRFMTTDYWESKEAFEKFKKDNADAYKKIDEYYSLYSMIEKFVGEFEVVDYDDEE